MKKKKQLIYLIHMIIIIPQQQYTIQSYSSGYTAINFFYTFIILYNKAKGLKEYIIKEDYNTTIFIILISFIYWFFGLVFFF